MRIPIWRVLCLAALAAALGAQETQGLRPGEGPAAAADDLADASGELPRQFREIRLGMSLEELKTALAEDGLFNFRGDRDVSFLHNPPQSLVETTGLSFIKRAFFQFQGDGLFIMAFTMNTDLIDHYSVFTALTEKYGEPGDLSPRQSIWENGSTRLALERPLTVKYIDMEIFNGILGESGVQETRELLRRQEFIDAL